MHAPNLLIASTKVNVFICSTVISRAGVDEDRRHVNGILGSLCASKEPFIRAIHNGTEMVHAGVGTRVVRL